MREGVVGNPGRIGVKPWCRFVDCGGYWNSPGAGWPWRYFLDLMRSSTVIDTPPSSPTPTVVAQSATAGVVVGFLSIVQDSSGIFGGYLVTNAWGRPLEFRISTAVQPNRVQQILYGPTLMEYLHADLIGKTLIEKTATQPTLLITDSLPSLAIRTRLGIPTLTIAPSEPDMELETLETDRASLFLKYATKFASDRSIIEEWLEQVDPAVDLIEPFTRIREAMSEARKMGVTSRAA